MYLTVYPCIIISNVETYLQRVFWRYSNLTLTKRDNQDCESDISDLKFNVAFMIIGIFKGKALFCRWVDERDQAAISQLANAIRVLQSFFFFLILNKFGLLVLLLLLL